MSDFFLNLSLFEAGPKDKETYRNPAQYPKEPSTTGAKVKHHSSEVTGSELTPDSEMRFFRSVNISIYIRYHKDKSEYKHKFIPASNTSYTQPEHHLRQEATSPEFSDAVIVAVGLFVVLGDGIRALHMSGQSPTTELLLQTQAWTHIQTLCHHLKSGWH